jgi:hypothetical protein
MGWHDATVHAVAFFSDTFEFALDLDYIFQWIDPASGSSGYTFWVAPVTMVFANAHNVIFDLWADNGIEIADITRRNPRRPKNADWIGRDTEWQWTIDCQRGAITLTSVGYRMYVRSAPVLQSQQSLSLQDRGGIGFGRG